MHDHVYVRMPHQGQQYRLNAQELRLNSPMLFRLALHARPSLVLDPAL